MFCESYRETLKEAALTGERLPAAVQAHLVTCESCRESFAEEKALFALLDAESRTRVNAEMPASLLPRVRQQIASSPAPPTRRWLVLAYVASGLAIGAIALSFAGRTKAPSVKESPAGGVSSLARNEPIASHKESGSRPVLVATSKKSRRPPQAAVHAEPEVLVSAEEQLGLQRYTASLRRMTADDRAANVKSDTVLEIKPLEIARMELNGLSIDPLQRGDSD
jgi:hypothetical protein